MNIEWGHSLFMVSGDSFWTTAATKIVIIVGNMYKKERPLHGLLLGAVPEVLSCLSYIERLLIVHVWVNSCFI